MGKETRIAWCDHTFNPWWGCFKISAGCKNCYAATFDRRVHGKDSTFWDVAGPRRFFGDKHWGAPRRWNAAAAKAGERRRVFCGSMCDWAEIHPDPETNQKMGECRTRLFELIQATPHLDWLLLSKRIENAKVFLPWSMPWPNVWVMTTVENQEEAARRIPILLEIDAVVRGLSCEPLLGPVELAKASPNARSFIEDLEWVIAGAESGHHARACDVQWLRELRDQCLAARVPFLLKQAVSDQSLPAAERPIRLLGGSAFDKGKVGGNPLIEMPFLDGRQHLEFPHAGSRS